MGSDYQNFDPGSVSFELRDFGPVIKGFVPQFSHL